MSRVWGEGAAAWVANEAIFDGIFAPVTEALLRTAGIGVGERLLDVGCGSGSLLEAAAAVGARAAGVDISPGMVEAARRRVPDAEVVVADAQSVAVADLPGAPYDVVVSRFGVMFFEDPVQAFANLHAATGTDGRLVFACWRSQAENPMFSLGTSVLAAHLDPEPEAEGAPGPSSLADPDHLRSVLTEAGWQQVRLTPFDFTCEYGGAGNEGVERDGVEQRLRIVLSGSTSRQARERIEARSGAAGWEAAVEEVRTTLRAEADPQGRLRHDAAVWLVEASAGPT